MTKHLLVAAWVTFIMQVVCAQSPLNHEKKMYVSPQGAIFINKDLPIYFRVSTSADDPGQVIPSDLDGKYANPMYLDTEGRNTLRSPSAIDPKTKKQVVPKQDVTFNVHADGLAPITTLKMNSAAKFQRNGTLFIGPGLQIGIPAADQTSGVELSLMSVNKDGYADFAKEKRLFDKEQRYELSYYSVDHVGNAETPQSTAFQIDLSAPVTTFAILGESKGQVLSSKASIQLISKDTLSGVQKIVYSINGGPETVYTAPIPLSLFKDDQSKVFYYAVDNVGNREESKVIETAMEMTGFDESTKFSFYIDKEAPAVSYEIVGDMHKTADLIYLSERSRFKINAGDEKSGVESVSYSIDNTLVKNTYSEPFTFATPGLHNVTFAAIDYVGNLALAQTRKVYVDPTVPQSSASFTGKKFVNRDTTFITKDTKLQLTASETGSGVQVINYTVDNGTEQLYTSPFSVEADGFHTVMYKAKDRVNNLEKEKSIAFFVDNKAPEILCNFSASAIGEKTVREQQYTIYPSNVMLYLASTDHASGSERIEYRINGKKEILSAIPVKGFAPGNYDVEVTAYDVLGNKSTRIIRFAIEN